MTGSRREFAQRSVEPRDTRIVLPSRSKGAEFLLRVPLPRMRPAVSFERRSEFEGSKEWKISLHLRSLRVPHRCNRGIGRHSRIVLERGTI